MRFIYVVYVLILYYPCAQKVLYKLTFEEKKLFVMFPCHFQELLVESQDEALDALSESLSSLRAIGVDINAEIKLHNNLLNGLEDEMQEQTSSFGEAQTQLQQITKSRTSKCLLFLIFGLAVAILFVLLTM